MKEKIEQYAKGNFIVATPVIEISKEKIQVNVGAGSVYEDEIIIQSLNDVKIKGLVYDSRYILNFSEHQFINRKQVIKYSISLKSYEAGDVIMGSIVFVTNGGEYDVPYRITVTDEVVTTSIGEINDLFHFTNLAQSNWQEAIKVFASDNFKDIFFKKQPELKKAYLNVIKSHSINQALEEFLVFMHKKKPVTFGVIKTKIEYDYSTVITRNVIHVSKNVWGYISGRIYSDGTFIKVDKKYISSDDFIGNTCEIEYEINPESISDNNNIGHIYIENTVQKITIEVICRRIEETKQLRDKREIDRHIIKENQSRLINDYLEFRIGNIQLDEYVKCSLEALSVLEKYSPEEGMYKLGIMHMNILIGNTELMEEEFKRIESDKTSILAGQQQYCYYNYIKALALKDEATINKAVELISEKYNVCEPKLFYFWLLIYLDAEYAIDKNRLYKGIRQLFDCGVNSPVLYYELCDIFNSEPLMLKELGSLEIFALRWGLKNEFLNDDVIKQFIDLASKSKEFVNNIFIMLTKIYEEYHFQNALYVICSMLIKGNKTDKEHHKFFVWSVMKNYKLIGLNECYIRTMDFDSYEIISQSVLLYFESVKNTLSENEFAYLYANVIMNKGEYNSIYKSYIPQIEEFMSAQIRKGSMNDNLAVIYAELLEPGAIKPKNAGNLTNIIFKRKLTCDNPNIRSVIVSHKELNEEAIFPLVKGVAYIEILTDNATIGLLDSNGARFISTIPYKIERLVEEKSYIDICIKYNPTDYKLLLYMYNKMVKYQVADVKLVNSARDIIDKPEVSAYVKQNAILNIVEYYYDNYDGDILEKYLMMVDINYLTGENSSKVITYFIIRNMYRKAFETIRQFGYKNIETNRLLRLVSRMTTDIEYMNDELLIEMSIYLFNKKQCNSSILEYLIGQYKSDVSRLAKLFVAAKELAIDIKELEENIVVQTMFADSFTPEIYDIFTDYYRGKHSGLVSKAFLKKCVYGSFIREEVLPPIIFKCVFNEMQKENIKDDLSAAALLYYFAKEKDYDEQKIKWISDTINGFLDRNIVLPVFIKYKKYVRLPKDMFFKTYLSFKTEPGTKVIINYSFDNKSEAMNYKTENMKEAVPGLYVKEFVVFHDEEFVYFIAEEIDGEVIITESDSIKLEAYIDDENESAFNMINLMLISNEMNDENTMIRVMRNYMEMNNLFEENLRIL